MDKTIINYLPQSFIHFVGLAVVLGVFVMAGTFFQEFSKSLFKKMMGLDRRKNGDMESSLITLVKTINESNIEIKEFVIAWKLNVSKISEDLSTAKETLEEVQRKQERNWKRLFEEELENARCKARINL